METCHLKITVYRERGEHNTNTNIYLVRVSYVHMNGIQLIQDSVKWWAIWRMEKKKCH